MNNTYKTNKTDWRRLGRSILFVALLLGASLPAMGQQYVFLYKNGNTVSFLSGTATTNWQGQINGYNATAVSTFDPSTCLFTGNSASITNVTEFQYSANSSYYLRVRSGSNSYGVNFNTSAYYRTFTNAGNGRVNTNGRYLRYNSGWTYNNTNNPGTTADYTVLFAYSNQIAYLTNPSITGDEVLTTTGVHNYSVTAKTKAQYHQFDGYSGTTETSYYWYNNALQTSAPTETNVTSGTWSLTGNTIDATTYASVNTSTGRITVSSIPPTDLTMTLSCTVTGNGITKIVSKTVYLYAASLATPTITRNGDNITLATSSANTTIYYTIDGNTPTSSNTAYSGPFSIEWLDYPVTVKAIAIRGGNSSSVATATYSQPKCAIPVISIASNGAVTITCATEGATIRYLKGDSKPADPTESTGTAGTSTTLTNLQYIKARAFKAGYDASDVAADQYVTSGVSGGLVVLDDRENHSWSYYSDATLPEMMRSLNPADVKITYYGNGIVMTGNNDYTASSTDFVQPGNANYVGGAKVNVTSGETQNTFVYYKTLERTDGSTSANPTGRCPYTTIPNPFQVRPTYGGTATSNTADWDGWRGFQCWRLKSVSGGSVYNAGGDALSVGAAINAETEIYFAPNGEYGMDVQLEAVWAIAYVVKASDGGANAIGDHSNVGYERNFIVLNTYSNNQDVFYNFGGTSGKRITNIDRQVTVTRYLPNGVRGQNNDATYVRGAGGANMTLQANTKFENVAFYDMSSYTLSADGHDLIIGRGCTGSVNTFNGLSATKTSNFKLRIESGTFTDFYFMGASSMTSGLLTATLGCDYDRANNNDNSKLRITHDICTSNGGTIGATGSIGTEIFRCTVKSGNFDLGVYGGGFQFYISSPGGQAWGKRTLIVEGGYFSDIAGGIDRDGSNNLADINAILVDIRIKGGESVGAVFGAAQRSASYGDRRIVITGGQFSGWIAGGANGTDNSGGQMGGASYVYVGGTARVDSDSSTTRINRAVGGNVFAAGCGYGDGTSSGQVKVGTNIAIADDAYIERGVYGGGSFGYTTTYSNIYLMGGTIDCIGGGISANGSAYNANVKGGIYGGACQNQAGQTNVYVYGGTVNGGVYGGGNVSGDVAGPITVDVYGTDPAPSANTYAINQVFGGGNQAAFNGVPTVTVHCGADTSTPISIEEVYGGGNQASVTGTNVTIEAGNIIGDVYGGGRQAAVGGNTSVTVNGGTIRRVFGGNNISGAISGTISVNVDKTSSCPMKIGQVFGGGNQAASQVGSITVGCTGDLVTPLADGERYGYDQEGIGAVYGGANEANITGDITLNIVSGIVDSVFGGNNAGGSIDGDITVTINKNGSAPCANHWYVGYVFGGGNMAQYSQKTADHPAVNVQAGLVTHHVFGGGNGSGATVTGNPTVTLSGTAQVGGNVFGGGNAAPVTGDTSVKLQN